MDAPTILKNLDALGPAVEEAADEVDRLGHLPDELRESLRAAGAFRLAWPARWGGPEAAFEDQIQAVESLAYHDASVAWNVQILLDSGFYAGTLADDVAHELYPSMDLATAGGFYPPCRAVRAGGGWRITGSWPFGSGIHSADRVVGGVHLYDGDAVLRTEDGEPEFRVAYLPADAVEILDTWHTTGLRGTGSTRYHVRDVFVPDRHLFSFFEARGADAPPLSRHADLVGQKLAGVALGVARRVLDETRRLLRGHAGDRMTRIQFAEAETRLRAARGYAYDVARRLSEVLFSGGDLSDELQAEATMATVHTGLTAREVTESAVELVGSSVIYRSSPLERRRRDLLTLNAHIGSRRKALEVPGGLLLGETALPRFA
ncbi:acyl-CoA dehydrogenase family protein [Pseudonocardia acaciae]|uniref:acyl-CoA dehydrogenase family protein n=1 Tax=Pseudonocardia acaciae TaxID=551276 RepID=UPI000491262E|nr:acyl-CoA dehydrogenase family protein [Pseudonocardia acaciae]